MTQYKVWVERINARGNSVDSWAFNAKHDDDAEGQLQSAMASRGSDLVAYLYDGERLVTTERGGQR